ncbi:MAG: hypothetical protein K2W92_00750 [Alphaproteobacteria bacterium]|nr:hypothetical protein [Alphaproteobacteria bacterium]
MKFLLMTTMALGIVLMLNNHQVAAATLNQTIATNTSHDNIVLVRGGCGWGHHRNWGGWCVPNWGGGWHHWHHWHRW